MAHEHKGKVCFHMEDDLTFGKHKGKTAAWVARKYPWYILWIIETVEWATVSMAVYQTAGAIIADRSDAWAHGLTANTGPRDEDEDEEFWDAGDGFNL